MVTTPGRAEGLSEQLLPTRGRLLITPNGSSSDVHHAELRARQGLRRSADPARWSNERHDPDVLPGTRRWSPRCRLLFASDSAPMPSHIERGAREAAHWVRVAERLRTSLIRRRPGVCSGCCRSRPHLLWRLVRSLSSRRLVPRRSSRSMWVAGSRRDRR